MPAPVKISDRLLARAKEEAKSTQRSVTAQIEHWATLGRAVEVMTAHRDALMLKRAGERLSMPSWVRREDVEAALIELMQEACTGRRFQAGAIQQDIRRQLYGLRRSRQK